MLYRFKILPLRKNSDRVGKECDSEHINNFSFERNRSQLY